MLIHSSYKLSESIRIRLLCSPLWENSIDFVTYKLLQQRIDLLLSFDEVGKGLKYLCFLESIHASLVFFYLFTVLEQFAERNSFLDFDKVNYQ